MNYVAVGLMSGSSLDGLDIAMTDFFLNEDKWDFKFIAVGFARFSEAWKRTLQDAVRMDARSYLLVHNSLGKYCGDAVNNFLKKVDYEKTPDVIGSHGHTTFHLPEKRMTHQLGDGAVIAAITNIPVVSDLRSMDIALGGQGAPIVPVGEKLLFPEYKFFMNIGGICNVSVHDKAEVTAFDVSPANRILNMLSEIAGKKYDRNGAMASRGKVDSVLLKKLNENSYYSKLPPKSLPNSFGTDILYPLILESQLSVSDALATYCEHIAVQTLNALKPYRMKKKEKMLVTGGGALNKFLINRLKYYLNSTDLDVTVPDKDIVNYKEALIMGLFGVLRLRGQDNVFSSVTGASRDSCGGALWTPK
jgi:anhydro-N-acetylmuramic acid kinase